MPKPLFSKLIVQAAIGFFCVLFGCAFSFQMEDMLFLFMSLAIGICCILRCVLLYRLIRRKDYRILTGTCTAREMSLLKRTQQIRLSDPNGREYAFTVDKNVKLLQGRTYRVYFRNSQGMDDSMPSYQYFLGFEEIAETD